MRKLRRKGNVIVVDDREWFRFKLPDGRIAATKEKDQETAKTYIEGCLGLELKEAV